MEQMQHENFTITRLCEVHPHWKSSHYKGILIGFYEHLNNTPIFNYPCRLEAAAFLVCTRGQSTLSCNMREYAFNAGDMIAVPPRSIIVSNEQSDDCQCLVLMIEQEFLQECDFNIKRMTQHILEIADRHVIHLDEDEQGQIIDSLHLLQRLIAYPKASTMRDDVMRAHITALVYLWCDILSSRLEAKRTEATPTRQESYFRQFIKELNEHYAERQSVTYYADKLCISARYLTTIVRRISGLTVTDWMNRYILMEAKYLLKYSDMSIQEISYKLSFPDQSFFGKYFKQHVGMSPSSYRNQK